INMLQAVLRDRSGRFFNRSLNRHAASFYRYFTQNLKNIGRLLDQSGTVADKAVRTPTPRIERRARHRHHLASLFGGDARGNQRAGFERGLHGEDAARETVDDAVAAREVARGRLRVWWQLREDQAAFGDG